MPRNIIVCCDGTGNEPSGENSNVVRLYRALQTESHVQIAYYHPGVGTIGARSALSEIGRLWTRVRELAFAYGVSDNIADAYLFLMKEFRADDRVFVFGFSRGAYTARGLCGLLHMCGLLSPGNEALVPYALRLFTSSSPDKFKIAAGLKATFCQECKPAFLGLWDTVSSVGWILDPVGLKPWRLPYTARLPDISVVRHAVSIDERRAFFRQNLVQQSTPDSRGGDVKEVWFAGVHSDVGGGYDEPHSGLSKIALRWILREAERSGLILDQAKVMAVLGGNSNYAAPDPDATLHRSLQGFWWLGELWPKSYRHLVSNPGQTAPTFVGGVRLNLGRPRLIPSGARIHSSVFERMKSKADYRPKNLPTQYVVEPETDTPETHSKIQDSSSISPITQKTVLPAKASQPRLISILTLATILAYLPYVLLVQRIWLLLPVAILATGSAALGIRSFKTEATSVPGRLDFTLGGIGAIASQSAGAFMGILTYGLIGLVKTLGNHFPQFRFARLPFSSLEFGISLAIVVLAVIGNSSRAVTDLAQQLYPQAAGMPTAFYPLISFHYKQSLAVISAVAVLLVAGGAFVLSIPALGHSWWFAFAMTYALIIGGALLRVGDNSAASADRNIASIVDEVKMLFERGGYRVVAYPRTGQEDLDPFLVGTPDLYAENLQRAFAIAVNATEASTEDGGSARLSELSSAAWALTEFLSRGTKERSKIVEPLVVLIGQPPPPDVKAYQNKRPLKVLPITSRDLLRRMVQATDEDAWAQARELLRFPGGAS
jgi:uncharacterized protein (DUF2235 family)